MTDVEQTRQTWRVERPRYEAFGQLVAQTPQPGLDIVCNVVDLVFVIVKHGIGADLPNHHCGLVREYVGFEA